MARRRPNSIASTFHPTHEVALTRRDGSREIIPLMLNGNDAYTLTEWETNANAHADWQRSEVGWRHVAREVPPGYVSAKVSRIGRGKDPRGSSKADKRVTVNARADQLAYWQSAANQAKQPLSTWAAAVLDAAAAKVTR